MTIVYPQKSIGVFLHELASLAILVPHISNIMQKYKLYSTYCLCFAKFYIFIENK